MSIRYAYYIRMNIYPYCALIMEILQQQEKQIFFANKIGSTLKQENGFIINRCS